MADYHDEYDDNFPANPAEEQVVINDAVKNFCIKLQKQLKKRDAYELQTLYEADYNEITEKYYKASSWPALEHVQNLVEEDENFNCLYKELYYRHIYAKLTPDLAGRVDSFQNYIDLFNMILGLNTEQPELELPTQWLWDMIDEFIFQFQSFHQYRTRVKNLTPEEIAILKQHVHIWHAQTVIRYLHELVKKSKIEPSSESAKDEKEEQEAEDKEDKEQKDDENEETGNVGALFKVVGTFALVGLLRVNCLLGDYTSALRVLTSVDLRQKRGSLFSSVTACYASTYYYMGLAYLMLRRYVDCARTISSFLNYINRNKNAIPRTYQQQTILKTIERMHGLLAIVTSFTQQRLDEALHNAITEKFGDQIQRMKQGDLTAYEEVFFQCCPKFVSLSTPDYQADTNFNQDAYNLQRKLFLHEMEQRSKLQNIYSYLKLCTTVSISKLADFLGVDEESCAQSLLCLKHKTFGQRWKGGPPLSGVWVSSSEVDFFVAKDVAHVAEYRPPRRYGEFFIKNILRFEDLMAEIDQSNPAK